MNLNSIWKPLGVFSLLLVVFFTSCGKKNAFLSMTEPRRVEILVLGHESDHHPSEKLMMHISTPLFQKGINLTYTADPEDLREEVLQNYDGLLIYANHDSISSSQEAALKSFVQGGKALIPLQIKDTLFLVEQSGGIVVKYYNRTFERIDESRTHHNQYHSIPFSYEDQIFLLGGYGIFTDKNILTTYSFQNKEWFETKTYGEKPAVIRDKVIHAKADDTIYFIGCDTVEDLKISPQNCWVYSLDLKTMTFSRLGILTINSYYLTVLLNSIR